MPETLGVECFPFWTPSRERGNSERPATLPDTKQSRNHLAARRFRVL